MPGRQFRRYTKRVEVRVIAGERQFTAFSSDMSERGVFVRTTKGLVPGSRVELVLNFPDNTVSRVQGVVKRTLRTSITSLRNGMGVELVETDENFRNFFDRQFSGEPASGTAQPAPRPAKEPGDGSVTLACGSCGARNKVRTGAAERRFRCGKCGAALTP